MMWKGQISEISLTSSEDKEVSSTGMSSGQRQMLVAQEGHAFLLV